MSLFKSRRKGQDPEPEGATIELRAQVLGLDPAAIGITRAGAAPETWGGLMELGMKQGTASLVCLSDGATSLYASGGGGMIGGEAHPPVVAANSAFLEVLSQHTGELEPIAEVPQFPPSGSVQFVALTFDGKLAAVAKERDLKRQRHPLWPVFAAGHDVITELRTSAPP